MKCFYLLFAFFILTGCSKEDLGPMGLKHGQEVEVTIDHRYGAVDERHWLLPNKAPLEYNIHGFDEREPGYTYKVKAKVHLDRSDPPIQDGASHWLNFMEIVSKEKYEGNEPFEIDVIQSYVPGGPVIMLVKEGESYFFSPNIQLTFHNEAIGDQLEEIWQHNQEIRDAYTTDGDYKEPKWKSIRATVTHDPDNFGKAYLVSHMELIERKL